MKRILKHQNRAAYSIYWFLNNEEYKHQPAEFYFLLDGSWCNAWKDFILEKSTDVPHKYVSDENIHEKLK